MNASSDGRRPPLLAGVARLTHTTHIADTPGVIWASSFTALFGNISFFLLLSALPLYFQALGYQPEQIGVIVGSTYAVNFLAYFLTAVVSDRWGGRVYLQIAALAMAGAPLIFEASHSIPWFIAASIWQGLTMSAFSTAITAYVGQQAPAERRGFIMALYGLFPTVAQAAAPPLGILVGYRLGYPLLFDLSALSALVALCLAFTMPRVRGGVARFGLREWVRGAQKLARPGLVQFTTGLCRGVTIAFMPLYMLRGGVTNPGLFFTWQIAAAFLLRPVSGALSDRFGRLSVILPGLVLSTLGIWLLALPASYGSLAASGIVFGIAVSVLVPTVLAWTFDVTTGEQRGLAAGIYNMLYDVGRAGSAVGFGFMVVASSYQAMFLVAGAVPLVAIVVLVLAQWRPFGVAHAKPGLVLPTREEVARRPTP